MKEVKPDKYSEPTQDLMAAVIGSLDDAVISLNSAGVITSWNSSAEGLFGYAKSEVLGHHIDLLMPPGEAAMQSLNEAQKNKAGPLEMHLMAKRRRLLAVNVRTAPIQDGTGSITGTSVVTHATTDNPSPGISAKSKELARMKHDIMTPMGTIKGLAMILGKLGSLSPKQIEIIDTLKESADDLHEMIEGVFEFVQFNGPEPKLKNKNIAGPVLNIRPKPTDQEKPCILLVDDYPPNILMIKAYLDDLGYKCDIAVSGFEALEKVSALSYDLILMDIQMPDMDGLETTRHIRRRQRQEGLAPTPILAATANATDEDRFACLRAGMDDCFSKRLGMEELKEKVEHFIPTVPRHLVATDNGNHGAMRP